MKRNRKRLLIGIASLVITSLVLSALLLYRFISSSQNGQVEASATEAEKVVASCHTNQQPELCYSMVMGSITKKTSFDHALKLLSQLQKIEPLTRGCHLISHFMSSAEAEKDISKWEEVIARMPVSACSGGFIHGVLESKQKKDRSFVINAQTIPGICEIIKKRSGSLGSDNNCSHIMGHLSLVTTKGSIPESIKICQSLPESFLFECASGTYMENETRDNLITEGIGKRIPWNPQTTQAQMDLCKAETDPVAMSGCWRELSHMFAFVDRNYPPAVYKDCTQAPTYDIVKKCYQHGVGIMTGSSTFDIANMKYVCQPYTGQANDFRLCYINAVGSLLISSPEFADRAIALCNALPVSYTEECYGVIGQKLSPKTTVQDREGLCALAPDMYRRLCVGDPH